MIKVKESRSRALSPPVFTLEMAINSLSASLFYIFSRTRALSPDKIFKFHAP